VVPQFGDGQVVSMVEATGDRSWESPTPLTSEVRRRAWASSPLHSMTARRPTTGRSRPSRP